MQITLKSGIYKLQFGMSVNDVEKICLAPDAKLFDEEKNIIYIYNEPQWRLTFYHDEDFRLGYIISSHYDLELFGKKIIGHKTEDVLSDLKVNGLADWEKENFDITESHFNEANWLVLQSEFGKVIKVEVGAIINDDDAFDWKFINK